MNESLQWNTGSLPLGLERQIDELCDEFEEALKRGIVPDADKYLSRLDESAHPRLLFELTKIMRGYPIGNQQLACLTPLDAGGRSESAAAREGDSAVDAAGSTTRSHFRRSLEILRQLDVVGTRFVEALKRGELLSIEEILGVAAADARPTLLRELLTLEMQFRSKRGDTPSLEEYRERFGDHARLVKHLYFEHFVPPRIGEFLVHRLLGRGGFGLVYQGWDAKLARNVAIKIFRHDPDDPGSHARGLLVEARMAAQLRHPGIVAVYAVMPDADGDEFLVLEYVDGNSLEDLLRSQRFSATEAADLLLDVVRALQHSHQQGLVHRDLKPANILLEQGGRPRLTDFGLALHLVSMRRSPEIAGTLAYMAPEQACGETHRLDARTDLWAIGVILYRMVAGRMPFVGGNRSDLIKAIRQREPQDLLERDPSIPAEIDRIVRKCLAKRMSERYQSAAELADDLTAFLNPPSDRQRDDLAGAAAATSSTAVVPKGLRCFDANDREFFLSLVPGPRDRNGIPDGVRFWENHLRELNASQTFRVGLLYGPSGCGKSSLIRAGILPRLPSNVKRVVVEAASQDTEANLVREIRRHFPKLPPDLGFSEILGELREGKWLAPGEKLLLVLDQFEQWLHGWRHDALAELVGMLRQCDGSRVQALILVRDDFWMPATRFFQQLDVPLVEGFNTAAVDLFDPPHAAKVLAAFGVAYGRLEADPDKRTFDQNQFVERAVEELAVGGWIVPVRLCIFAEMVKSRPWSLSTLREVGGAQGLGTAFLEEGFDSRSASPMHRLHRKAARLVLERLLPPAGTHIRGHLVSEAELRSVSGYEQLPFEFAGLMNCLDHELRLITPSDTELARASDAQPHDPSLPRLYQLTHDFLVRAIRGWLNQSRRRTMRGRAELRLAEYAEAYSARHETRQLPSFREWLGLVALTRPRTWSPAARNMMQRATRHHAWRYGLVLALALALGLLVYNRMAAIHAEGLVRALATSDSRDVPRMAGALTPYRAAAKSFLQRAETDTIDQNEHVRILLGLVAVGEPKGNELFEQLLEVDPPLAVAITEVLLRFGQLKALNQRLWEVASNPETTATRRLRASVALARQAPASGSEEQFRAIAPGVAALMLSETAKNPDHFGTWVDGLMPMLGWLDAPLRQSFGDGQASPEERLLAAKILARFAGVNVEKLLDLALQSTPKQLEVFIPLLTPHGGALRSDLLREAQVAIPPDASEDEKDRLARRQANAILLLHRTAQDEFLWSGLVHRPDPRLRSFLMDQMRQSSDAPAAWMERLSGESDPGVRQALILVLGSQAAVPLSDNQRAQLTDALLGIYRNDVDSGVHSAAEWTLGRLGAEAALVATRGELSKLGIQPGFHWYVTKSGLTMAIFEPTEPVTLGSPEGEPGHESDEGTWTFERDWTFAISTMEITNEQYLDVCEEHKDHQNEFAPDPECPVNAVNWFDAARFCRLLSERDGFSESEMVMPPARYLPAAPFTSMSSRFADFHDRMGYRLPIEGEWEIACRAGTTTSRFFGYAPDLLPSYCCYIANSGGETWSIGGAWPNQAGLFDILGNIAEWCFDVYIIDPSSAAQPHKPPGSLLQYAARGNAYGSSARMVRSANRRGSRYSEAGYANGFRITQTIRPKPTTE